MNKRAVIGIIVVVVAIGASMALTLQTFDDVLNTPLATNQKLGLVINTPSTSTDLQQVKSIYEEASTTGIGRSNAYMFWNMIEPEKGEFDWRQSDILMSFNKNNNLQVTLYFSVINGKTLGPFPDWIGKPNLISIDDEQLANTLDAILTRYHIIDTVVIAGETDEHFRYNEVNIPVYRELFENVYDKLKEKHPDVKIGNAYSLHGVMNKNLEHVVSELNVGDFIGFTYFPVDALNDITKTPQDAKQDLEYALELANGKNVGFFEVSWSTSDFVNGNESDQQEFIANTYEFYNENEQDIEFLTWYRQYDRPVDTCVFDSGFSQGEEDDITVGGSSGLGSSEFVIERLSNYVCTSGLITTDGVPKPGWNELKTQIANTNS